MKKYIKYLPIIGLAALSMPSFVSCSDEGFAPDQEGVLKMRLIVNSEVTRDEQNVDDLAKNCIIYVSSEKGLIHKFTGAGSWPDGGLVLKTGHYVIEAWAGDSVTASFDKKFYKAYHPCDITPGVNNLAIECKIANVVASVNPSTVDADKMSNYKVTVGNSRGSLDFTSENISDLGYFMMPNDDTTLTWTISGKDAEGKDFSKSGEITDVKPAHHYILNVKYGSADEYSLIGGACITIEVDDTEIVKEDEIILHSAPKINGAGFDINGPLSASPGSFNNAYVTTAAFGHYADFVVDFGSAHTAMGLAEQAYNLEKMTSAVSAELEGAGVKYVKAAYDSNTGTTTAKLLIPAALLNKLPEGDYPITLTLTSDEGLTTQKVLRIKVSEALVSTEAVDADGIDYRSLVIPVAVLKDNATNIGVEYREKGTTAWNFAPASATRSNILYVTLTGLRMGTIYEYRSVCDDFKGEIMTVTTKFPFRLPNYSFEEWSTTSEVVSNKSVIFPGSGSSRTFWDTGNHGSATVNKTLTNKDASIKHSGNYSAKLASENVVVKFAAGNLFVGRYVGTDGTDGVLEFGRPFEGPRPTKLTGWVNYRPGKMNYGSNFPSGVKKGDMDNGQIFIALTTSTVDIRTKASNRKLFDPNDDCVVGYGEVSWGENVGPDGGMTKFEIPVVYKAGKENVQPTHIIIVCSASKWGDYFVGGDSTMYLDDFELVYE